MNKNYLVILDPILKRNSYKINNELVLEEKAIYTVEKFLSSRRIMYLQVYLHKTALVAEKMLKHLLHLVAERKDQLDFNLPILELIQLKLNNQNDISQFLQKFTKKDDIDIWYLLKTCCSSSHLDIAEIAQGLMNRRLLKVSVKDSLEDSNLFSKSSQLIDQQFKVDFCAYDPTEGEILIKSKNSDVYPLSSIKDFQYLLQNITRYYTIHNSNQ